MKYTSKEVYEHISKLKNDSILERKTCCISWTQFPVYESDELIYKKCCPQIWWREILFPFPKLCPEERLRRRMIFRNERHIYKWTCAHTWSSMISVYHPNSSCTVFDQKFRWSDDRDPMEYGHDIAHDVSFLNQFWNLLNCIPQYSCIHQFSENCDYCPWIYYSKNCYLSTRTSQSEGVLYSYRIHRWVDCVDCHQISRWDNLYSCYGMKDCSWCFYSNHSISCSSCYYVNSCTNCEYCINCSHLYNKKYRIDNKPWSKELYDSYVEQIQKWWSVHIEIPFEQALINNECENCLGSNNFQSKNCFWFWLKECENVRYGFQNSAFIDCLDCYSWWNASRCYEMTWSIWMHNCMSWVMVRNSHRMYYSMFCFENCRDCFWCVWLRNKQYCIFNKQYSKIEYEKIVLKIIEKMKESGIWWEFFDPSLSPFGYNETVAHEYFPLEKDQATDAWFTRQDDISLVKIPEWTQIVNSEDISSYYLMEDWSCLIDNPNWLRHLIDRSILKKVIICEKSWKPFRYIKQEIEFYEKHNILMPCVHPDMRHQNRLYKRPWMTLYVRTCDGSWEEILSIHEEDAPYKVYSEEAYIKKIHA